jgi:type I restriction enzyme R subunit
LAQLFIKKLWEATALESNFSFLKNDWNILATFGEVAEKMIYEDVNTSVIKIRQLGEYIASAMIKSDGLDEPADGSQLDRIKILKREGLISNEIEDIFHLIRKKGNSAVHKTYIGVSSIENFDGDEEDAHKLLALSLKLSSWFNCVYGSDLSFDPETVEYRKPEKIDYKSMYNELTKRTEKAEKIYKGMKIDSSDIKKKEREARRKAMKLNLSESETRELIDYQLREAGWEADTINLNYKSRKTLPEKGRSMAIAEYPCMKDDGEAGWADYALFINREFVGIIEAKKYNTDIPGALKKDSRMYSKGATLQGEAKFLKDSPFTSYKVPFMYASNGREYNGLLPEKSGIWFLDGRKKVNSARAIKGFHSPKDLIILLEKDDMLAKQKLENEKPDYLQSSTSLGLRDYQIEAIKAVEKAFIEGKNTALLTMATGTGKTRTAIGLIYRLIKAKKYNRILFLVDRSALGNQAKDSFNDSKIENLQSFTEIYDLKGLDDIIPEDTTKVHIATIQGLVQRVLYSNENKPSIGQYDCIVVDEAHRGYILNSGITEEELEYKSQEEYLGKYRRVIDYFEADKIALTATPAKHTAEIFGEPVYSYGYRQAVIDGYLVDHEPPYTITTKLLNDGISYGKGEVVQIFDSSTQTMNQQILDDEISLEVDSFNRKVINENFNRVMCKELVKDIDPNGEGKTLIFAVNDNHADMIVRILKEEYRKAEFIIDEDTIAKQTGYVKDIAKEIKKFKNELYPNIVVTVDLLTTGIDVPKICNLVFMRKVRSRILYEQMLGRATRRCDEIEKNHFKIFDCVDLYKDLKDYTDMKAVVKRPNQSFTELTGSMVENKENFESIKGELIAKLQRKKINVKKYKKLDDLFKIESGRDIETFIEEIKKIDNIEELVKEIQYINYLDDLKLGGSKVIVSELSDEMIEVKRGYGKNNLKPNDYLEEFKEWVNSADFDAIKTLRDHPEKVKREDILAIKKVLDSKGYSEQQLKSAYTELTNENITADILNFVKYAIKGSPIVDFNDKVHDIMKKIYKLHKWSVKQKNLLKTIENQLKNNHIITLEEVNSGFLKERYGGEKRVDKTLDFKLQEVLNIIQEEILLT